MFFAGTLQEGIGKAIQEQKRVVCFVRSDDDESTKWENDFLKPLDEILRDHAVVIPIQKDSPEAGFLSAICSVDTAPLVAVISNGQVKGELRPPMTVDDFRRQILTAMDLNFKMSSPGNAPASSGATSQERATSASSSPNAGGAGPQQPSASSSAALSDAMADRRRRMAEQEAADQRRKEEAAEARRQAVQDPTSKEAYQAKLAEDKKKQRQAALDERKRVLDLIEADKQERRKQAAQRAAQRTAQKEQDEIDVNANEVESVAEKPRSRSAGAGGKCRLQLRLWDGRTEKAEFMAVETLSNVKKWIEWHVEPNAGPYSLKEVIGVGAARQFGDAEERMSLASLGLTPSATLIVRPIVSSTSRIDGQGRSSVLGPPLLWLWNAIIGFFLWLWAIFPGFVETDQRGAPRMPRTAPEASEEASDVKTTGVQAPRGNIQTLDDRRKKKDKPTLYNGNQLGVLPNPADKDENDDAE